MTNEDSAPVGNTQPSSDHQQAAAKPRRRFVGAKKISAKGDDRSLVKKGNKARSFNRLVTHIPQDILEDKELNEAIKLLPSNYNFEIHKTVWNIRKNHSKKVAIQMPEGLLVYSLVISDILQNFCDVEVIVMGDVSYGACCIDDYTARSLDCDFIVHYAHSCLVPIDVTSIKILYVFVTIDIDINHLYNTLQKNFDEGCKIAMFGTIQFNPTIHQLKARFESQTDPNLKKMFIIPPQIMPLSKGEVLGCTSTKLNKDDIDFMVYVGDGRFHLESAMIHNPDINAYRYDPYSRKFTHEYYDTKQLVEVRSSAVAHASKAQKFGLILGGLGRQGSNRTVDNLERELIKNGKVVVKIILSEIFPFKLAMFDDIDCFVQVACPRLSIDWGYAFNKPLLTPYETMVLFKQDKPFDENFYPMDYYAKDGYGRGSVPARS
ncbi:2-(3-amino-3-carboxypropyl)histidine synthase [Saccharomycopsis crataegensis]|uniref:2-(3-amino-3-carboxypropyl)histidine synthase subunit 1 n=1 Tax=Saccharomycopsis crataegensis TaxID=43959 RepID=A0AAV5QI93_9ASCO|nr:2-(3-amino-3-carboxypropyl)histidine synthase [Saccharomycopsis crataegensis]